MGWLFSLKKEKSLDGLRADSRGNGGLEGKKKKKKTHLYIVDRGIRGVERGLKYTIGLTIERELMRAQPVVIVLLLLTASTSFMME